MCREACIRERLATDARARLLREDEEAFELTPEEEEELLESIAEIERGEFISGEQLLERLRRFG
jgi:hypothetical protein